MPRFSTASAGYTVLLCFQVLSFTAQAQEGNEEPTLQDAVTEKFAHADEGKYITVVVENDSLGTAGTDKNYTSGVRLSYLDINLKPPKAARALDRVIPTFGINETSSVTYSIGQNIYSPQNIEERAQDPDDRPWAAHLYGSMGLVTVTDNHLDEIEASIGIVGPAALGNRHKNSYTLTLQRIVLHRTDGQTSLIMSRPLPLHGNASFQIT